MRIERKILGKAAVGVIIAACVALAKWLMR